MKQLNFTLLLALAIPFFTFAQTVPECTLPFFSEMIDGHPKNKVLEIYNPSEFPIDASDLAVLQFINGNNTPIAIPLSGVIAPKETFVLSNQNANSAILVNTDQVSNKLNFNGNDAIALVYTGMLPPDLNEFPVPQNAFIDIIGEIGVNPGNSGWAVGGGGSTSNYGLRRKEEVRKPEMNWGLSRMQWTSTATIATSNLGQHVSECARATTNIQFDVISSSYPEDYYNSSLGTNEIYIDINVTGGADNVTVIVKEYPFTTPCASDLADWTDDYSLTTSSIHIFSASSDTVVQAVLFFYDDNLSEADESICLELDCLGDCNIGSNGNHQMVIVDNEPMGIENRVLNSISLYPNLVSNTLSFRGLPKDNDMTVTITNVVGQTIKTQKAVSQNFEMNVSDLENGMYFAEVRQEGQSKTLKFIKQ